jgi:hypothetical protein
MRQLQPPLDEIADGELSRAFADLRPEGRRIPHELGIIRPIQRVIVKLHDCGNGREEAGSRVFIEMHQIETAGPDPVCQPQMAAEAKLEQGIGCRRTSFTPC